MQLCQECGVSRTDAHSSGKGTPVDILINLIAQKIKCCLELWEVIFTAGPDIWILCFTDMQFYSSFQKEIQYNSCIPPPTTWNTFVSKGQDKYSSLKKTRSSSALLLIDDDSADLVFKSIKSYINGTEAITRIKKERKCDLWNICIPSATLERIWSG